MIVVAGPKRNEAALVAQAQREFPEEAMRDGVLFVPEDILSDDEEIRSRQLLAIHDASLGPARIRRAQASTTLGQLRREAWRAAGL